MSHWLLLTKSGLPSGVQSRGEGIVVCFHVNGIKKYKNCATLDEVHAFQDNLESNINVTKEDNILIAGAGDAEAGMTGPNDENTLDDCDGNAAAENTEADEWLDTLEM